MSFASLLSHQRDVAFEQDHVPVHEFDDGVIHKYRRVHRRLVEVAVPADFGIIGQEIFTEEHQVTPAIEDSEFPNLLSLLCTL